MTGIIKNWQTIRGQALQHNELSVEWFALTTEKTETWIFILFFLIFIFTVSAHNHFSTSTIACCNYVSINCFIYYLPIWLTIATTTIRQILYLTKAINYKEKVLYKKFVMPWKFLAATRAMDKTKRIQFILAPVINRWPCKKGDF